ncbi:MAG: glycosyltransferase [Gammaproteobacteria bacterium]|nr:glycosyltransferase [Gammaproteobacteria bacterium]
MPSHLVTVIIRTKDRIEMLSNAIDSVSNQSHQHVELIVVNDGGCAVESVIDVKDSPAISQKKTINFESNQGRSAAANAGLDAATGKFIMFLDDDDWVDKDHIASLLDILVKNKKYKAVYSATECVEMVDDCWQTNSLFDFAYDRARLLVENYIPIHSVLFSRELLESGCRFDRDFEWLEDWDFWLQVSGHTEFYFLDKKSAYYRVSTQSGFGSKSDDDLELKYREMIYQKWYPLWSTTELIDVLDRARSYPKVSHLQQLVDARINDLKIREEQLGELTTDLEKTRKHLDARAQQAIDLQEQLDEAIRNREKRLKKMQLDQEKMQRNYITQIEKMQLDQEKMQRDYVAQIEKMQLDQIKQIEKIQADWERLTRDNQLEYSRQLTNLQSDYEKVVKQLQAELQRIYQSRSWRYSRPLRQVSTAFGIWKKRGMAGVFREIHEKNSRNEQTISSTAPVEHSIAKAYKALKFPPASNPLISIVIPVFNKHLYTFHCLKSILDNTSSEPDYEIIVVNDQSTDETGKMLKQMSGLKVINNAKNQGFIRSINLGAKEAAGDYLVILNNDTEVQVDWLQEMHKTFANFPDAGMVGAKLVYPNGDLQEAGGIVWQNGTAWNYGRNDDPEKPDYCYARAVDYCSGACLMIPRESFAALGMFDELYAPAYYEDTDLAFKVRQSGKKVYYQPNACVIHFEGVTSGTDTDSGAKQYQLDNHKKFFERWKDQLQIHGVPGKDPNLAKDRSTAERVLIIDERMIMPDNDSGSLRMFSILKILMNLAYKITFMTNNLEYQAHYSRQLQRIGVELQYHPYVESIESYLREFGNRFSVVILSRVNVAASHIDDVRSYCPNAQVIFDTVDLHFLREQREAKIAEDTALMEKANKRKEQELGIARKSDVTVVVSPVELDLLKQEDAAIDVALLSNIHINYETSYNFDQRKDILFIGGFEHPPNGDAMEYFIAKIFPLIIAQRPEICIYILGSHPPEELLARESKNIIVTGFVSDIEPYFSRIKLSVAPLRFGAGVKGKINSSMSFGVPVVATTIAAEGMGLVDGEDVLIGDTADDFARQVLLAYDDRELWQSLSDAGKSNIEKYFSFSVAEQQLQKILSSE